MGLTLEREAPRHWSLPAASGDLVAAVGIVAVGGGLDWLSSRHAASPLAFLVWGFAWPDYLVVALAVFWYVRGIVRSPPEARPGAARVAAFVAGISLLFIVLQTGFLYLAEHMFFLHRVQHLVMHHLGPFLIALAWPGESLMRGMPHWLSRGLRRHLLERPSVRAAFSVLQQPVVAAVLFVGLVFLWVWPPLHFRAMVDARLFAVMDWSMILDGIPFFVLVLDPRPVTPQGLGYAGRILLVMSVQVPQIALGGALMFVDRDLYPWYSLCGRAFASIGPIADQQLGGVVILFGGGMMSAVSALILFGRLWRAEEASVSGFGAGLVASGQPQETPS